MQNEDLGLVLDRIGQPVAVAYRRVIDEDGDMLAYHAAFIQDIAAQPGVLGKDLGERGANVAPVTRRGGASMKRWRCGVNET